MRKREQGPDVVVIQTSKFYLRKWYEVIRRQFVLFYGSVLLLRWSSSITYKSPFRDRKEFTYKVLEFVRTINSPTSVEWRIDVFHGILWPPPHTLPSFFLFFLFVLWPPPSSRTFSLTCGHPYVNVLKFKWLTFYTYFFLSHADSLISDYTS